jgi:hypothetical protein
VAKDDGSDAALIAYLAVLLLAAFVVWAIVTYRRIQREYLREMAASVRYDTVHADPWEQPRIVKVNGGVYDVLEEGDLG